MFAFILRMAADQRLLLMGHLMGESRGYMCVWQDPDGVVGGESSTCLWEGMIGVRAQCS